MILSEENHSFFSISFIQSDFASSLFKRFTSELNSFGVKSSKFLSEAILFPSLLFQEYRQPVLASYFAITSEAVNPSIIITLTASYLNSLLYFFWDIILFSIF